MRSTLVLQVGPTYAPPIAPLAAPPQITGSQNAEFVRFSGAALTRAQGKLAQFLSLMPRDAVEAARRTIASEAAADE